MAVHCVEVIAAILANPDSGRGPLIADAGRGTSSGVELRDGTGWVDGARGLLVHRYVADAEGQAVAATVLTPTAQNEGWLAEMLTAALAGSGGEAVVEAAIREADPCLPCSTAPPGRMGVRIVTVAGGPPIRRGDA
jgi:NAD-reducing hydrogenase large subunit